MKRERNNLYESTKDSQSKTLRFRRNEVTIKTTNLHESIQCNFNKNNRWLSVEIGGYVFLDWTQK